MKNTKLLDAIMIVLGFAFWASPLQTCRAQWTHAKSMPGITQSFAIQGRTIFAGCDAFASGGIFRSDDSGNTWTLVDSSMAQFSVLSIYAYDSILLAGTYKYGIFRSTDSGKTWHPADSGGHFGEIDSFIEHNGCLFAGVETSGFGGIIRSTDGGRKWSREGSPLTSNMGSMVVKDSMIFVAGGGATYFTSNDGKTWELANGVNVSCYAVSDSFLFESDLDGFYRDKPWWNQIRGGKLPAVASSLLVNGQDLFASFGWDVSSIYRSTDNGDTWKDVGDGLDEHPDLQTMIVFGGYLLAGAESGWGVYRRPLSEFAAMDVKHVVSSTLSLQNNPNPVASRTTISYTIPKTSTVSLVIVDALGNTWKLIQSKVMSEGEHTVEWSPEGLSNGVYFYRLTADSESLMRRMLILR